MSALNEYTSNSTDWRRTLRQNHTKTMITIVLFFLIYGGIGLLIDAFLYADRYPRATPDQLFEALITFNLFPTATVIMLLVAGFALIITYTFYDSLMLLGTEYHAVDPTNTNNLTEKQLYNVVDEMRIAAGLRYMPKVFIIDADYMNAFASGYSEKSALVAITRGLIQKLDRDELQAVMAHEISHIRHLDIKLTLTASLLANLSLMVLDMFFYNIIYSPRTSENDQRSRHSLALAIIIIRYILPVISMLLLMYLSRTREYMADAGCVELMRTNEPLARALLKIHSDHVTHYHSYQTAYASTPHENVRREAYIFDPSEAGIRAIMSISDLFSTHPNLESRLAALGYKKHV